ncbi:MAG: protein phosphatase CheZ [Alphaproteobacteria bacterium]|nr:protein phosphatase CheZ [Alphaproteobacteria bacterium]
MSHVHAKVFSVERREMSLTATPANPLEGIDTNMLLEEIRALRTEVTDLRAAFVRQFDVDADADDAMKRDVRVEIAQMVRSIGRAKAEIAAIKHPDSDTDQVEVASSQLEAITQTTEIATNEIMTAVDDIEQTLKRITALTVEDPDITLLVDEAADRLISIIEACSFQDLTGQRVTQVVSTLRFIESRILAMIDIWGLDAFQDLPIEMPGDDDDEQDESELLNGPALGGQGLSQDDIDALFD